MPMNVRTYPSPSETLLIANAAYHSRYKNVSFAYATGSILHVHGTQFSDIDLAVVFASLEAAYREFFVFDGVPMEAFVHDAGTLTWFMNDDVSRGIPSILHMAAQGRAIGIALAKPHRGI